MKRSIVAMVATLVLTSVSQADELWGDLAKILEGHWTAHGAITADGDGPLKPGDKFTMRGSFRAVDTAMAIVGTQVLTMVDPPHTSFNAAVTFGWDPVGKTIKIDAYWSDAVVEQITLRERSGEKFLGTYSILLSNGTKESAEIELEVIGTDKFVWRYTSGPHAGKALSTWQRTKSGATGDEYLTFWKEYFQGEWATEIVEGEETGIEKTGTKGFWKCELGPTKACMLFSGGRNGVPSDSAVAGYDPQSRAWKEVFFLADGGHVIQWYRAAPGSLSGDPTGKVIKGEAEYVYADGRVELAEISVKFLGRDKCEYSAFSRSLDGKKLPDIVVAFERKKQ